MPDLADLKVDPATGMLSNPGDFTPGQLLEAQQKGLLTYQGYHQALPLAAKPADNSADIAAQKAATPDLRYGTNVQGQAQPPPAPAPVAAPAAPPPAPGVAQMQPTGEGAPIQSPGSAALATLLSPRGTGGVRSLGMSPADKEYAAQVGAARQETIDTRAQELQQSQDIVAAHAQQVDALQTESKLGAASFQESLKRDDELRAQIDQHGAERERAARRELDRMEAQGVDPNHYWRSLGTAGQIGAAFAIGLGELGAHPLGPRGSGGPNRALGIIQDAIAADIDAQKANLQKAMQLADKRGQLDERGFNRELAFANAVRDSHQVAYNVVDKDIQRRIGLLAGNDEMKQNGLKFQALVREQAANQIAADSKDIYAIHKRAETPVSNPATAIGDKIRATAKEIYKDSKGTVTFDQALRQAGRFELGVDVQPGAPEPAGWDSSAKNAGKLSPRLVARLGDLNAQEMNIGELTGLLKKGSSLSPAERSRAQLLASQLRPQFPTIPENPLAITEGSRITGSGLAALGQALKDVRIKKQTILTAGGGGSEESPEDLGGEKDE